MCVCRSLRAVIMHIVDNIFPGESVSIRDIFLFEADKLVHFSWTIKFAQYIQHIWIQLSIHKHRSAKSNITLNCFTFIFCEAYQVHVVLRYFPWQPIIEWENGQSHNRMWTNRINFAVVCLFEICNQKTYRNITRLIDIVSCFPFTSSLLLQNYYGMPTVSWKVNAHTQIDI